MGPGQKLWKSNSFSISALRHSKQGISEKSLLHLSSPPHLVALLCNKMFCLILKSKTVPIMHLLQISIRNTPYQILTAMQDIKLGMEDFWIQSSFSGFAKLRTPWALRKTYSFILDTLWLEIVTDSVKQQLAICSAAVPPRTNEYCQGWQNRNWRYRAACKSRWQQILRNHKITYIERDLWRSHSPTSYSEEVQLDQVAQSFVLSNFDYPQWLKVYKLSGQTLSVPDHPQSKFWVCFPSCNQNFQSSNLLMFVSSYLCTILRSLLYNLPKGSWRQQ